MNTTPQVETIMKPLGAYPRGKMANHRYSLRVMPYLLGQMRIQLMDHDIVPGDKHESMDGVIVQEMCTYKVQRMREVTTALALASEPLTYALTLATPYNCESPGGRIRLDNQPGDRQ